MTTQPETELDVLKPRELVASFPRLPSMSAEAIAKVRVLESLSLDRNEGIEFPTEHLIHAGMYARTLHMRAGTYITGALLKIPTTLIVSGDCIAFIGEESIELSGYNVLPGSAFRKQIFAAITDTNMTMLFPTSASTVEQAEQEFTDEYELLMTNHQGSVRALITGE